MTTISKPVRPGPVGNISAHRVVLVSVATAAVRVGNSTRTIKRWIKTGLLPATRLPSPKGMGPLRVRLSDLESLIAAGCSI